MTRKPILIYIFKKILTYIVVLLVSFTVIFFVLRLIPGNPIRTYINSLRQRYGIADPYSEEIIAEFEKAYGIDKDIFTQYFLFLKRLFLEFNLGPSFLSFPTPTQELILQRLPWSIALLGVATIIAWVLGILAGVLVGWKQGTRTDSYIFTFSIIMAQIPFYLLALTLVLFLAYVFPLFPTKGGYSPTVTPGLSIEFIASVIYHAILPSLSLVVVSFFGWLISTRALTISILGEDYLQLAQAKGLKKVRILRRYVMRNILLPQTTGLAMSLGFIVNGAFLLEWIFVYPGIGTLFVNSIGFLDFNTIQGIILLTMFTVLTANLLIDLIYPLIDPRITHEGVT